MPNIKNTGRNGRDEILSRSRTGPLGAGLEYRTRGNLYPQLNNFAYWASGTITTTRRTLGMPLGSAVNIGSFPEDVVTLQIASTSTNDTLAGTGAQKVTVRGLDRHLEEVTISNIEMNGQTPVTISGQLFKRILRIFVDDTGSTNSNEGDIYLSDTADTFIGGIPQNRVYSAVIVGENNDTFGHHTVPANKTQYLIRGNQYNNATSDIPILIEERYIAPNFTGTRTDYTSGALWYSQGQTYNFDGAGPVFATTDITWIATSSTGVREGAVYYELSEKNNLIDFDNTFSFTQNRNVFS